jgi:hypothetical protein
MPTPVRDVHVENLLSGRRMLVEWTPNSLAEGVTAYEIWRSTMEYQGFEKIAEVNDPTYQFIDKLPYTFGIVFFYKVIARDASGLKSDISQSNAVQDSTFDDFEERPFRSITLSADSFVVSETPTGIVDGANKTFTVAHTFRFGTLQVFINGVNRFRTTDFSEDPSQISFTFVNAPALGSTLVVNYVKL